MTPAKAILLLFKNKKVRKFIIGIVICLIVLLIFYNMQAEILTLQNSTALASTAEEEYSYWEQHSPSSTGFSCQGEKYCSHFNFGVTDWCCFFVGYCIDASKQDKDEFGYSSNVHTWVANLKSKGKLKDAGSYTPNAGNPIFFDYSGRQHYKNGGMPTHIGIVTRVQDNKITVIAGNEYNGATSNWAHVSKVRKYTLSTDDNTIACYGAVGDADSTTFSVNFSASTEISQLTRNVIAHNEIGVMYDEIKSSEYGFVLADDNGALSIGVYQWHGNNARDLLKTAYSLNSNQITKTGKSFGASGNRVLTAIKQSTDWSSFIPEANTCNCIKAMLLTEAGKKAQDQTSLKDADQYIKICKENGLKKSKPIVYCSDILNQWGTASFNANVYGNGRNGVLHGVTAKMSLEQIYTSKAGWGSSEQYKKRRTWTYNYLKNVKIK